MTRSLPAIIAAAFWISLSEFVRNEFLFKKIWVDHYTSLGLTFPSDPINGAIWGLWSLAFAIAVYIISRRFTFLETIFFSWFVGFILMWVVTGNLGVLPFNILKYAVPLSLLESGVATWLVFRIAPKW